MQEDMLIFHCAPTLAGLKTGNLFSCPYEDKETLIQEIRRLNQQLGPKGLRVIPMRYCEKRVLLYVYRPSGLVSDLSGEEARSLLEEAGYANCTADQCVIELARRLQATECFPHEIGLFLSYPPEDVRGFIENKGADCRCVGCWKVYGDEEKARKTFQRYKKCTDVYCDRWRRGFSVERLTVAR